ncbi:MAG TPA: alpha/beta hydrolase [Rhizomicrobium sp.]|nr:alpha/beta hydrolase [Rhizomicrobium sp.]
MTDFAIAPDGTKLAYDVAATGTPVVLVHGFGASRIQNWKAPGWYDTLTGAGYQVIAMDCRGHGESDKPHDPERYGHETMARDVIAVMDAVGLETAHLMGYSMGGYIGVHLLLESPDRVLKFAIGGVGETYLGRTFGSQNVIADALEAEDKSTITDPTGRTFREFAEQPGKDRLALAACMRGERKIYSAAQLALSTRPVLVVCGETDQLTGAPGPLADAFEDGRAVTVARRDHMTTVGDKVYKNAVLEFFNGD